MNRVIVVMLMSVAACSSEPRSPSYFVAHPDEADRVLAACQAGEHRGAECANAEASVIDRERKIRMEMARRGFQEKDR